MSIVRCFRGSESHVIPAFKPAESVVEIDGRLYRIRTWTAEQWQRIPAQERPSDAFSHGLGMMQVQAS